MVIMLHFFNQTGMLLVMGLQMLSSPFFFISGRLIKELNHTFLTLVPKTTSASHLTDYRLISCCNVLYKFISKVLANRLQKVIEEFISPNQSAFLKGRLISDCSLLAHEVVREFNKPMGSRARLKVDLQKAFDSVNIIYFIFHCMGFPITWITWIKECLSSPTFSVMINGSPTDYFSSNQGIRQGCPHSPYIFVMVIKYWSIKMELSWHQEGLILSKGPVLIIPLIFFLLMICLFFAELIWFLLRSSIIC